MSVILSKLIDIFFHLDKNLVLVVAQYGTLTYGFLFFIIFLETGFVVTPFLPGDSLIFAAGALSASSSLNIYFLYVLFCFAAILGDTVNYWLGHLIGPKVFEKDHKFIKKAHLIKTQRFFEKYGGQAITLGRFVPIIRTFIPFVAGVGKMNYRYFLTFNIVGGVIWVSLFLWSGWFFGNLPFVKDNFHYVVLAIIVISVTPIIFEWLKSRQKIPSGH